MATRTPPPAPAVRPLLRGWSHLLAFALMLVAGPLLVARADPAARWFVAAHVVSLTALFGVSALYHRKLWQPGPRAIMRRLDHATIFVLIAGTYTAVGGLLLPWPLAGWLLLPVWIAAAAGAAVQVVWPHRRVLAAVSAGALGWAAVLAMPWLSGRLTGWQLVLLGGGGLLYSAGAVAYATKRPRLVPHVFGYHEVFHLLVIGGAVAHSAVVAGLAT